MIRGGGHPAGGARCEEDISRRADNDDIAIAMNQVKIHQSHKVPTCNHYQKRMKKIPTGEREYLLNKCCERTSSIRLFMVRHGNAQTEGLRHFLS
jgi:hypothetical protein